MKKPNKKRKVSSPNATTRKTPTRLKFKLPAPDVYVDGKPRIGGPTIFDLKFRK